MRDVFDSSKMERFLESSLSLVVVIAWSVSEKTEDDMMSYSNESGVLLPELW